jgi:hypothetical protein
LTLWNDLEINIDHYHQSGWLGEDKVAHYPKRCVCEGLETRFWMNSIVALVP